MPPSSRARLGPGTSRRRRAFSAMDLPPSRQIWLCQIACRSMVLARIIGDVPALTHASMCCRAMGWLHLAQAATCPPSVSVRQASIADITLSWLRLTCPALARRHAGPCLRNMSAISSLSRGKARALPRSLFAGLQVQQFERFKRAGGIPDHLWRDFGILGGGRQLGMVEQHLPSHRCMQRPPGNRSPAHPGPLPADGSQNCDGACAMLRAC